MADYDAWLVDLDGTLYHALPVRLAMAFELVLFGLSAVRTIRVFRHEHEVLRKETRLPEDAYRLQLARAAAATGAELATVESTITEWMHVRPGRWLRLCRRRALLDEIRSFRAKGGKTAVVSDYPARQKLESLGALELFDTVVANGETGGPPWIKPDPSGYLLAAERLGVSPSRCLVIGDRDDADGAAARSANMAFRLVR